jgi:predicted metal-dependent peptidase
MDIDKEERKLKKVKINIMRDPDFALWSGIMMVGKTYIDDNVATACTNGRDERYGRKFVAELSEKELAFVVLHEAMHKAYRHLTTWRKLYDATPQLANAACDYVINLQLKDLDPHGRVMVMPQRDGKVIGLIDEKYRGMTTKEVYDALLEEHGEDGGGGEEGFDEHDWGGAGELSEEEQKELSKEVEQALRQGDMTQRKVKGNGAGGLGRELGEMLAPQVNWREQLREYVKSICSGKDASSWRRVNRRFIGNDIYMPTLVSERVGHLVVAVDTSGSIAGKELNEFLTEVKGIAEEVTPEKVDLLYWDSHVTGHEEYSRGDYEMITQSMKPRGGGGTDPGCVPPYLKEKGIKPDCIIMLTDGQVFNNWGKDWPAPVLWVICGNRNITAGTGKTIHMD